MVKFSNCGKEKRPSSSGTKGRHLEEGKDGDNPGGNLGDSPGGNPWDNTGGNADNTSNEADINSLRQWYKNRYESLDSLFANLD